MNQSTHAVFSHPVIPLATVRSADHIDAIGDGLSDGGLPVVEVALRGEFGIRAIRRLAARGDLVVGAGTVLGIEQAREALDAGAQFVVTPGLAPEVVAIAGDAGVPIIPGVLTPTEVQAADRLGVDRVKLFPAAAVDAGSCLHAYADVYPRIRFMPSGGIRLANLTEYLSQPSVFAVTGSWITADAEHGSEAVADACRQAIASAVSVRSR